MKKSKNKTPLFERKTENGLYVIVACALMLVAAIAVNLLVSLLPESALRIDRTGGRILSLSDATKKFVSELDEDVTICLLTETGAADASVEKLLSRYAELSPKIKIQKVDPTLHPTFSSAYTTKELSDSSLIFISGKRSKALDYNELFRFAVLGSSDGENVVSYGELSYEDFNTFYETNADYFEIYQNYGVGYTYEMRSVAESAITSSIDYVVSDALPVLYCTSGHGETPLPDHLKDALYTDNVTVASLSLMNEKEIPADASAVLLNAPNSDLSTHETSILLDFCKAGGNLILFGGADPDAMPNLASLSAFFGMESGKEAIYETNAANYTNEQPYYLLPDTAGADTLLDCAHRYLILPYAKEIVEKENPDGMITYSHLFSTETSARITGEDPESEGSVRTVAMLASRSDGASMLFINAENVTDEELHESSAGGNGIYLLSLTERLVGRNESFAISSKTLVEKSLAISSGQAAFWAVILIAIVPLVVASVGIGIYVKRKKRL